MEQTSTNSDCLPRQVHLSPGTPADTSMWVSWVTKKKCTSVVNLKDNDDLDFVPKRFTDTTGGKVYTTNDLYSGYYSSGYMHHVLLTDLLPSNQYTYSAGGGLMLETDSNEVFNQPLNFETLPAAKEDIAVRIAVVGDLGQTHHAISTMNEVNIMRKETDTILDGKDLPSSFLMIVGDLSYADGNGTRWDTWGTKMAPFLSSIPLVAFPGNHEIEIDSESSETFMHFRSRFKMPETEPEYTRPGTVFNDSAYDFNFTYEHGSSYYSFNTGPVHVVCLNTYTHTEHGSEQYSWLESDLISLDRRKVPWVLVFAHGPWYNSNLLHQNEVATLTMRENMEPLLHRHRVAGFWAGHVHAYERTHPAWQGQRDDDEGCVFVTIGDGGNREGLYDRWKTDDSMPEWVAFRNGSHYGRGDLVVLNKTHLRWQWWPNGFGAAEDDVWIINPYTANSESIPESKVFDPAVQGALVMVSVLAFLGCVTGFIRYLRKHTGKQGGFSSEDRSISSQNSQIAPKKDMPLKRASFRSVPHDDLEVSLGQV